MAPITRQNEKAATDLSPGPSGIQHLDDNQDDDILPPAETNDDLEQQDATP